MKTLTREAVNLLQVLYIALVTVGFSYLIGLATTLDLLLVGAIPLGVLLVGLLSWLKPRAQLLGWAAVTAWLLSSVYLGTSEIEYLMLLLVFLAAIAGVFWSPWFIAAIWFVHPLWDLIPRELPAHQHYLPLACLMYDLVVAIYLTWRIRKGFFETALAKPEKPVGVLKSGLSRTLVALAMLTALILEILIVGTISMDANSIWFAAPVALLLIGSTLWVPIHGQKVFWLVFTIWTGMTFAHSGEALELAVFALMIVLAVLGYRVSVAFWVGAWAFHALWHLLPREHLSHSAAMLMGHWMTPVAGLAFGLTIASYLTWLSLKKKP